MSVFSSHAPRTAVGADTALQAACRQSTDRRAKADGSHTAGADTPARPGCALQVGRDEAKAGRVSERPAFMTSARLLDGLCLLLWAAGTFLCEEPPVAVTLLLAVAVHECGHVAAFLLSGEPPPLLRAGRLGLQLRAMRPMSPRRECLAALAGPAANLLCALVLWLMFGAGLPFYIQLLTAAGNLAPVGTLDGGRILRTLCEVRFSPRAARLIWRAVSLFVLCAGLCVSLCALWCRGEGGYLFFLCFSLFLSHIAGKDRD